MADISSYPRKSPKLGDLVLFSETYDTNAADPVVGNLTKSATVQDIIDLVPSTGGGGGSVTSVAATGFDGISVVGSPITSSGTLFLSLTDGGIPTAKLASNIITINGTSVSLGGSIDIAQGSVTSVGLSTDVAAFQVTNSPVTSTGTLGLNLLGGSVGQFLRQDGTWATLPEGLVIGTTSTTAKAGDTVTITTDQAAAIVDNTNNIVVNATSISTETASRISADNTLTTNLSNEVTNRINADTTLQSNITVEASTRAADDITLQTNIDNEASTRSSADSVLTSNLSTETTNRTNADTALQNQITSNDTDITNLQTTKQNLSEKNQANGYAPLDSGAKIPLANLPDSILGQLEYKGTWNANTDNPTLPSASTVKGNYYVTSVAGVYSTVDYAIGDWVVSNGTVWEKVDNSDAVTTVFGRLGNVVANESDYSGFYPLISDLNTEISNRTSADTTLQNNINSEASTRATNDITLQTNITAEASTRASADTTLQSNINTEASTRASADIALQTEIDNIVEANDATITIASGTYLTGGAAFTLNQAANETITLNVTATDSSTASTIAARDASGDLQARLFRSEYDTTNATVGLIMTQVDTVSNNYIRPTTPAQFRTAVTDGYYAPATGGSYLPLAGGTLTGALSGTSGSFSSSVSANGLNAVGGASNGGTINIGNTAAYRGVITYSGASQTNLDIINSYTSATAAINFKLGTAGTPITALKLLGSGAATFASSVSAGGNVTINTSSNTAPYLFLTRNAGANGVGVIQTQDGGDMTFDTGATGAGQAERMRITSGGNVGIGTDSPSAKLDILAPFGGATKAVYIEQGEFNQIGLHIKNTNGASSTTGILQVDNLAGTSFIVNGSGNVGIGTTVFPYNTKMSINSSTSANNTLGVQTTDVIQGTTGTILYMGLGASTGNTYGSVRALGSGGTANADLVLQSDGGNVGIGTTSPGYKLDVTGTIRATGDVIAYSDARVKDNVVTIEDALEKVTKLRGVSYTRNDVEDKTTKIGVIAQEVLEVLPEVVQQDEEGRHSVAYGNMVGLLIEAMKELKAEVDELKSRL